MREVACEGLVQRADAAHLLLIHLPSLTEVPLFHFVVALVALYPAHGVWTADGAKDGIDFFLVQ
jgi:hypothetical protein